MIKKFFGKDEKTEDKTVSPPWLDKALSGHENIAEQLTEIRRLERQRRYAETYGGSRLRTVGLGGMLGAASDGRAFRGKTADMMISDEVSTPKAAASDPIRGKIRDKVTDLRASGGMQNSQIADILEELLDNG
jgi:hypothetical protein